MLVSELIDQLKKYEGDDDVEIEVEYFSGDWSCEKKASIDFIRKRDKVVIISGFERY